MKLRWSRQFPWVRAETDEQIRVKAFFADVRQKTWVQVLTTGELAVLDHLKPCRRYGVRPVDLKNAAYYRAHGAAGDRIFSMPYAIDNAAFSARAAAADTSAVRSRFDLPEGRPVVLFVGKLMPRKRPDLLDRIPQKQLAALLNLSAETLSRLRKRGAI